MPCESGPSYEDVQREKRMRDAMARLACTYCKELEARGEPIPDWAVEWWTIHKAEDRARELREAAERRERELRESALMKLTGEEQQALMGKYRPRG